MSYDEWLSTNPDDLDDLGAPEEKEVAEMASVTEINEQILASLVSSARALRSNDGLSDDELRRRFNHFSVSLAYREMRLYHEQREQQDDQQADNRASAR